MDYPHTFPYTNSRANPLGQQPLAYGPDDVVQAWMLLLRVPGLVGMQRYWLVLGQSLLDLLGKPQHLSRPEHHPEAIDPDDALIPSAAILPEAIVLFGLANENLDRPPAAVLGQDRRPLESQPGCEEGLEFLLVLGDLLLRAPHYDHAQPAAGQDRVPVALDREHLGLLFAGVRLPLVWARRLGQLLRVAQARPLLGLHAGLARLLGLGPGVEGAVDGQAPDHLGIIGQVLEEGLGRVVSVLYRQDGAMRPNQAAYPVDIGINPV